MNDGVACMFSHNLLLNHKEKYEGKIRTTQ